MENIGNIYLNLMQSIIKRDDINQIIIQYKHFFKNVLNRDIPHIDESMRNSIVEDAVEFIKKMIEKGYLNSNNIYECLERFTICTRSFGEIINNDFNYGDYCRGCVRFNFQSETAKNRRQHVLFHEFVHALTRLDETGQYNDNKALKYDWGEYHPHKNTAIIQKSKSNFNVINREYSDTIIDTNCLTFLDELMAESTACDLLDDYNPEGKKKVNGAGMKSDWITEYNRQYQQLGYEFLETVFEYSKGQDDRQLFKKLTLQVLNHNVQNAGDTDIGKKIQDAYKKKNPETWKKDLNNITRVLGNLAVRHYITTEDTNRVRKSMKKYQLKFTPIDTSRTEHSDNRDDI